jgi:hypothetical protein
MVSLPESTAEIYTAKTSADDSFVPNRLREAVIALSVADTWHEAKHGWKLVSIFFTEVPGTCLCGHPILENCVLYNRENGRETIVGNVCVARFLGLPSGVLFAGLRTIIRNRKAALNWDVIEYAREKCWINDWERTFYLDTLRKRRLSPKQRVKRVEINLLVLRRLSEGRHRA